MLAFSDHICGRLAELAVWILELKGENEKERCDPSCVVSFTLLNSYICLVTCIHNDPHFAVDKTVSEGSHGVLSP